MQSMIVVSAERDSYPRIKQLASYPNAPLLPESFQSVLFADLGPLGLFKPTQKQNPNFLLSIIKLQAVHVRRKLSANIK